MTLVTSPLYPLLLAEVLDTLGEVGPALPHRHTKVHERVEGNGLVAAPQTPRYVPELALEQVHHDAVVVFAVEVPRRAGTLLVRQGLVVYLAKFPLLPYLNIGYLAIIPPQL